MLFPRRELPAGVRPNLFARKPALAANATEKRQIIARDFFHVGKRDRAGVLPAWARWSCGVLLIVAFPFSVVVTAIFSAGGFLLGATWALVGAALLTTGQASVQQPARVS